MQKVEILCESAGCSYYIIWWKLLLWQWLECVPVCLFCAYWHRQWARQCFLAQPDWCHTDCNATHHLPVSFSWSLVGHCIAAPDCICLTTTLPHVHCACYRNQHCRTVRECHLLLHNQCLMHTQDTFSPSLAHSACHSILYFNTTELCVLLQVWRSRNLSPHQHASSIHTQRADAVF